MWCPDDQHKRGEINTKHYKQVISEVELDADFGHIEVTSGMLGEGFDSIEAKRIHTQMQVAIVRIGNALEFRTWIARNDRPIVIENTHLGELEGVISSLEDVPILYNEESKRVASLIDCIWFTGDYNHIPAVIEIEHSTGVSPGLMRMLKFRQTIPAVSMTCTVVAPNVIRNKVVSEANNDTFRTLKARYMAYSTVRELYGLIQRYRVSKVDKSFINPFMEQVVED